MRPLPPRSAPARASRAAASLRRMRADALDDVRAFVLCMIPGGLAEVAWRGHVGDAWVETFWAALCLWALLKPLE